MLDVDPGPCGTTLSQPNTHRNETHLDGLQLIHVCYPMAWHFLLSCAMVMLWHVAFSPTKIWGQQPVSKSWAPTIDIAQVTWARLAIPELWRATRLGEAYKVSNCTRPKGPQTSKPGLLRTLLSSDGIYPWKWNCSAKVQEQTKICLQKWNEMNESPLQPRSQRHCPSSCCSSDTDWARRKCSMTVGTSNSCTYLWYI